MDEQCRIAFVSVLMGGNLLTVFLFLECLAGTEKIRWLKRFEFTPQSMGGYSTRRLVFASFLALYLEMMLIRWISSEIRIFAYFKNFVLIACFLGFGLGCYLCRRTINLLLVILPLTALTLLIATPWEALRCVTDSLTAVIGANSEVYVWGARSLASGWQIVYFVTVVAPIVLPIFLLLAMIFIPIGQMVGWHLENARNGVRAYSVNVLASLMGILFYSALCYLYQPPAIWFAAAATLAAITLWNRRWLRWTIILAFTVLILLLGFGKRGDALVRWSPYQKLSLTPAFEKGVLKYALTTNDTWYQQILDLSPGFVGSHPELFRNVPIELNAYNLPYRFFARPGSVLVLGAGMGNDVAAALRNGGRRVVAVEIDPMILQFGKKFHFEKPYDSPLVYTVLDDARSYIQNSKERFDLIVFSLLDSHTTSSHYSNIRIDNYVYTVEALQAAKRLLTPQGVFIVKFQVDTPWIAGRLRGLLDKVFGQPPIQIQTEYSFATGGRFFITGSPQKIAQALTDSQLVSYVESHGDLEVTEASLTTDDWPYFYQHEPGLPLGVVLVSLLLGVFSWIALRKVVGRRGSVDWHFFFLGAGFLLLEVQIISKMALLFGTTWVVNSFVVSGMLILIVGSNLLAERVQRFSLKLAYVGLFGSVIISYYVPLRWLFFESIPLKAVVSMVVLCSPVFFAGLIFVRSFANVMFSGEALGSNLLGALVGGLLESISYWTGLKSLLAIAALLYLGSTVALLGKRGVPNNDCSSISS